jgi:hypothetical protein
VKRANNDRPEPIEGVKTGRPLDVEANEYYVRFTARAGEVAEELTCACVGVPL